MRKVLIALCAVTVVGTCYADDSKINLSKDKIYCENGDYRVTKASSMDDLKNHCTAFVDDTSSRKKSVTLQFTDTDSNEIECKFKNNRLTSCEYDD